MAAAYGESFWAARQLACGQILLILSIAGSGGVGLAAETSPSARAETAVALNSVGYLPDSAKVATIRGVSAGEFVVRESESGKEVLRGRIERRAAAADGRQVLATADFSALSRDGNYRIKISGLNESPEFSISQDIFNWPFYCSARAMYLWRCGCGVKGQFGKEMFQHGVCHAQDALLDHVGGPLGDRKDGRGGWHDAGDYNKYTVNGAFTVGMMLKAWEHHEARLATLTLDIPESKNSLPDFLDEARWELEWLLKMQAGDGRAYHKLSTIEFGGFILPDKETAPRYFSPWSSAGTADLAAVMAQAARIYRRFDPEFAGRCLAAAEKSYRFLDAHPEDQRPDLTAFKTGPYDAPDEDDRIWAAAELWETTGDAKYLKNLERRLGSLKGNSSSPTVEADWDWGNVRNLGVFTYILSKRPGREPSLLDRVRKDTTRVADAIAATTEKEPFGRTLGSTYYWGCNGTIVRQAMNLYVAGRLAGDDRYRATILSAINHVLGRNLYGRSYVTGLGHRPPVFPHDRRSGGDDIKAPWPGYLVGGAWPTCADWEDMQDNYKTNEIAINWNGALIYALAGFVEPKSFAAAVKAAQEELGSTADN
jgi:endoglucanase